MHHLDHSGYIPSMYVSGGPPLYATAPTMELSQILVEDMIKIQKCTPVWTARGGSMMNHSKYINYKEKIKRGDAIIECAIYTLSEHISFDIQENVLLHYVR